METKKKEEITRKKLCPIHFNETWRQARTSRGLQVARKPPFRQKKKKKKKGRCASTAASVAAATKPSGESPSHFRKTEARRVYPGARWGVELGRGTAVPTVPTQTVSSSVVADRSVFSSKPRLSGFVRS